MTENQINNHFNIENIQRELKLFFPQLKTLKEELASGDFIGAKCTISYMQDHLTWCFGYWMRIQDGEDINWKEIFNKALAEWEAEQTAESEQEQ